MKVQIALVFLALIASGNCWGLIAHKIKDAFHHLGSDIRKDDAKVKAGFQKFGGEVKQGFENMDEKLKEFGEHLKEIPQEIDHLADSIAERIDHFGEEVVQEAEKIYQKLKVPLECAKSVIQNIQIVWRFKEVMDDPSNIETEWTPMADELYDMCVTCSGGNTAKFAWIKAISFDSGDMDIALCAADIVDVAKDAVEMADIVDDIDVEIIISFINSLVDLTQDCPSAINYIKSGFQSTD